MTRPRTLYEKIWDAHVVEQRPDGTCLIFIDRHLVHEVTSPQAFAGLRASGRTVRRPDAASLATLLAGGPLRMVLRNHEVAQVLTAPN